MSYESHDICHLDTISIKQYTLAMNTIKAIYNFFILLVMFFFAVIMYQYNLINPFINQVVAIANPIINHAIAYIH
jgi:hypothetical protein